MVPSLAALFIVAAVAEPAQGTVQLDALNFAKVVTPSHDVLIRFGHGSFSDTDPGWEDLAGGIAARVDALKKEVILRGGVPVNKLVTHRSTNPEIGLDGLGQLILAEMEAEQGSDEENLLQVPSLDSPQYLLIRKSSQQRLVFEKDRGVSIGLWLKRNGAGGMQIPLPGTWEHGDRQAAFFLHDGPQRRRIKMASIAGKMNSTYDGKDTKIAASVAMETEKRKFYFR